MIVAVLARHPFISDSFPRDQFHHIQRVRCVIFSRALSFLLTFFVRVALSLCAVVLRRAFYASDLLRSWLSPRAVIHVHVAFSPCGNLDVHVWTGDVAAVSTD